jgi:hypothetical protein
LVFTPTKSTQGLFARILGFKSDRSVVLIGVEIIFSSAIILIMNAAEIIEEIQRLPDEERGKVVDFVLNRPNADTLAAMEEPLEDGYFKSASELFSAIEADEKC